MLKNATLELFDRQQDIVGTGERALLVYVEIQRTTNIHNGIDEFCDLAKSSGISIINTINVRRNFASIQYLIGPGKVKEIAELVKKNNIELVIFSSELSPSQERNLEKALSCQVMDRTGLILDIFALRARSFEGKLQVELAQLRHLSTRLIRGWSHLERQKGGIGLRGPGETQLETDKRLIGQRIKYLKKRLDKVHKQRDLGRKSRVKNELPMIALAGYTNAGKSTLFNQLTGSTVFADSQLFATLDATIRRVVLPASGEAVIADTVGFIQNLPHDLVAAFKSTLEETVKSDIILHVVDASDDYNMEKITQVEKIINEIGAADIPDILVMNKIDCLQNFIPRIDRDKNGTIYRVWVSAQNGKGIDLLCQALSEKLSGMMKRAKIQLDVNHAHIRSEIYNVGYIHKEKVNEYGQWVLEINVTNHYLSKLLNKQGVKEISA